MVSVAPREVRIAWLYKRDVISFESKNREISMGFDRSCDDGGRSAKKSAFKYFVHGTVSRFLQCSACNMYRGGRASA